MSWTRCSPVGGRSLWARSFGWTGTLFAREDHLSRLRFKISMSLDGFVAGPRQSRDDPLGIGGMRLHEWVFPLTAWRAMHGLPDGEVNESTKVVEDSLV